MNLPDARGDGFCCDCARVEAVTRDGRFCKRCLRARIRGETPDPKRFGIPEMRGRRSIDSKTLGGAPRECTQDGEP